MGAGKTSQRHQDSWETSGDRIRQLLSHTTQPRKPKGDSLSNEGVIEVIATATQYTAKRTSVGQENRKSSHILLLRRGSPDPVTFTN